MTNFRKTALALASAFMMAGAAGAAGLPDILERDAAGTSAAQKAGAELARLVDGKDDAEAARRMEEREAAPTSCSWRWMAMPRLYSVLSSSGQASAEQR